MDWHSSLVVTFFREGVQRLLGVCMALSRRLFEPFARLGQVFYTINTIKIKDAKIILPLGVALCYGFFSPIHRLGIIFCSAFTGKIKVA